MEETCNQPCDESVEFRIILNGALLIILAPVIFLLIAASALQPLSPFTFIVATMLGVDYGAMIWLAAKEPLEKFARQEGVEAHRRRLTEQEWAGVPKGALEKPRLVEETSERAVSVAVVPEERRDE